MRALRSKDLLSLAAILDDDVEVVEILDAMPEAARPFAEDLLARRRLPAPYQAWCAVTEGADDDCVTLEEALSGFSDLAAHPAFSAWLCDLVDGFACLNDASAVGIRLSHLRGPMCPRFHVDHVPSRMIVSLAGPGTEWLPADAVRRDSDGRIAQDPAPESVQRLAPGSIGLLKGAGFDDGRAPGVVHRSPPGKEDRILLTLDAIL
ncbi:MAG: DUF1826 domain-containing protein [Pseudomonadales bacterium]|jgi:hypothetical protein|nr:DUF1826 domain-containing protein [Pseudomonadales bacterium]